MSRAYRKLLRERDALAAAATTNVEEADEEGLSAGAVEDEETESSAQPGKVNLFALLNAGEDVDEEVGDDEEEEEAEYIPPPVATRVSGPKPGKKKKKKGKGKNPSGDDSKPKDAEDDGLDEIDRTLKELDEKFGQIPGSSSVPTASTSPHSVKSLLSVDPKALDADAEMRRMFGSRVVNDEIRRKNYLRSGKRTALAVARENWPKWAKLGLAMDLLETKDELSYFAFNHSRAYQEVQMGFFQAINTHDPHTMQTLLHVYPYHIDSLLQLSEVCKHSGDIAMAAELVERALFAFERSFHSQFNIATGTCRVSYMRFENRSFHLAIFRQIGYIARRGCWRTAFEFTKLLLSLDPDDDPLGTLLSIDFYAISANEHAWYKRLWEEWAESRNLMLFPNHAYGIALATWELENQEGKDHSASSRMLQKAIAWFPSVVAGLYEKTATSDSRVSGDAFFLSNDTPDSLQLLIDLYVERNHSLWKVPEVLAWLRQNVASVIDRLNRNDQEIEEGRRVRADNYHDGVPRNLSRHIFISDFPSISAALPPDATASGVQAYDPLPPENAPSSPYSDYENSSRSENNPFSDMGFLTGLLRNLLPWMNVNRGQNGAGGEGPGQPEDIRNLANMAEAVLNPPNELIDAEGDENVAATIRAAQEALPGLFPPATEENPNPDWMAGLRDTMAQLRLFGGWAGFGAGAADEGNAAENGGNGEEGIDEDQGDVGDSGSAPDIREE
ncbi:hypothetical protein SpCBS45565_g04994 [Spizellomyces sp. 'palustris']|nr:hypothetical protein SpCBS45565_g04994 [Spizellomyces sp. 'palustris']